MRLKFVLICVIVILTAVGAVLYLQLSKPPKIENLSDLLTQDVLICFSLRDIDSTWDKIKSTKIYSQFINSAAFKDNPNINALRDKTKEKWFGKEELSRILGKEALMGIFFRSMISQEPEFDIILLSRISQTGRAKEFISGALSRMRKDKLSTRQHYKGYRVNTIEQRGAKDGLSYLILGDVLIVSSNLDLLKAAVDLSKNGFKDSISCDNEFKLCRNRLSDDYLGWLYLDIKKLGQLTYNLKETAYPKLSPSALDSYFLEVKLEQGIAVKGWSYFDTSKVDDPSFKAALASLGDANLEALQFMPLNTAMFFGGNFGDIKLFWAYIKQQLEKSINKTDAQKAEGFRQSYLRLNTILGFDLENDLFPYLGNEYAFSLAGFREINAPFSYQRRAEALSLSLPEFFGCIKVSDKEKINNIMQGLWQRMNDGLNKYFASLEAKEENVPLPVCLETNNYSGVDIYALKLKSPLTLPFGLAGDIFSPSYCFLEDYLVVTTNDSLLKLLINTYQKKNLNLSDSVKFSQVRHNLQPEFNSFFYANPKEVIEPLSRMFGSLPISQETNDTKDEEYRSNLIKTLQLLDMLKDIKGIGSSWVYKDNFYEFYIFVPVEGL